MKLFFKSVVAVFLFWHTLYCPTKVFLNNLLIGGIPGVDFPGVSLDIGPTVVTSDEPDKNLELGKHYTKPFVGKIEPYCIRKGENNLARTMLYEVNRHKLPTEIFENVVYTIKTPVCAYNAQGEQIGAPVELVVQIEKLPGILASKMKYGIKTEGSDTVDWSRGRRSIKNWCTSVYRVDNNTMHVDERDIDFYSGEYRMWDASFFDVEFAWFLRPFSGATFNDDENNISLMSYNVWMLPEPTTLVTKEGSAQGERAKLIPSALSGLFKKLEETKPDVVVINELFTAHAKFKKAMKKEGWTYSTRVLGTEFEDTAANLFDGKIINGGVAVFSRWPIVATDELFFSLCEHVDCLSAKGVVFARIKKGNKFYDVYATHVQADEDKDRAYIRAVQLEEIKQFIKKQSKPENVAGGFLVGDLNISAEQKDEEGQVGTEFKESVLERFEITEPARIGKRSSVREPKVIDFVLPLSDEYPAPLQAFYEPRVLFVDPWVSGFTPEWQEKDVGKNKYQPADHLPVFGKFVY